MEDLLSYAKSVVLPLYIDSVVEAQGGTVPVDFSSISKFFYSLHKHYQPFYIFLTVYAIVSTFYLTVGFIFVVIEKMGWLYKYKINKETKTLADYKKCCLNLMLNMLAVVPLMLISGWPAINLLFFDVTAPIEKFPSWTTVVLQLILCLYIEDFAHYVMHRILHTKHLYKLIHKRHHEFEVPMALSGNYADPMETGILSIATFLPIVIIPNFHLFTFYTWITLRWLDASFEHCGYDIMPHYLPFHGGVAFHDAHHSTFNYNYGSRFTWLDKLLNTYKDPASLSKKKKTNKKD